MRFVPADEIDPPRHSVDTNNPRSLSVETDNDRERQLDEEFISNFIMKNINDERIVYNEKVVGNREETVAAIKTMDNLHDLFIVGREQGMISPLTAGLTDWSECLGLGAIGDLLVSSDFTATVSVLVVQQYVGLGPQNESVTTPDSPGHRDEQYGNVELINKQSPQQKGQPVFHSQH
ncbi:hypothetical protein Ddye_009244 [Dipteronia dyeriana]|uniref:Cation/H(+) antiporter C-terminal domain-containing protein n=1 Tax=Dipteronia dyeriana TaxID=168575 RepID=A0AAD9XBD9_9ROSI|nr:hypothetical protein Ddye_009244 [Dipteronia dyeriana]